MAMKYRYVSNGKYKTRWRPGPVDAIMMAHRANPPKELQSSSASPAVKPVIAATLRRFSTSALISIRAPHSVTKATIPNQTATPRANAEYVRQSRIDPTPRICPPSFRKHSTRHGHASNKQSASSNASSVSHFDARRRRRITARSSRLLSASS